VLPALLLAATFVPAPVHAAWVPDGFVDEQYTDRAMDLPVAMAFVPGSGRLLVAELRSGNLHLFVDGRVAKMDPVLTVPDVRIDAYERGLHGIAVDPDWPSRPYVYVQYTSIDAGICISRYRAIGDLKGIGDGAFWLDPESRYDVIADLPDRNGMHNGGTIRFGPDGMLYSSLGDDDSFCPASDIGTLVGKILRLRVNMLPDGPGGPPSRARLAPRDNPFFDYAFVDQSLVWAYGLRNPFRFAIDSFSGELLVADVGADTFEEVDLIGPGGGDYGWPSYEGPVKAYPCGEPRETIAPIYAYDRSFWSTCATIIAGVIYRPPPEAVGAFPPEYTGDAFVSDACAGFLRRLRPERPGVWSIAPPVPGQTEPENWATGFGQMTDWALGPDGALYYCQTFGGVRRIRTDNEPQAALLGAEPGMSAALSSPWPSPGRGPFGIEFSLQRPTAARLEIFDLNGRRLRMLADGAMRQAGRHRFSWDARDARGVAAPAGVYFARLSVAGAAIERRFVLLR